MNEIAGLKKSLFVAAGAAAIAALIAAAPAVIHAQSTGTSGVQVLALNPQPLPPKIRH